ncbi:unnamed protein product [Brassica rapa subsp. trilocularis]
MGVLAWLNGSDGRMVNQEWFGHDDRSRVCYAMGLYSGKFFFSCVFALKITAKRHFELLMTKGYWIFYNRIHSDHFIYLERKGGLLEFIEKRIKLNGHMVIVLAEEHGKS